MRAIVLAGGEGTRLRPLTWRTPKALVPVANRPLLEHLLSHLRAHGVTHATLALTRQNPRHNHAIRAVFGDGAALGLALDYAFEDTPLGSGGAIATIAAGWDGTFFVCNGDILTDLDLTAMLENHRAKGALLSISLHEVDDPSPFGVVDLAADGTVRRFVEKPRAEDAPSRLINAGTWIFEPSLTPMMDATAFNRVEDTLFPALCAAGRPVQGFHRAAYWADVGSAEALLRANLDRAGATPEPHVIRDATATVHPAANVGRSVIGASARIDDGATVRESVLWDGVHVAPGAVVERSILASGVCVGAGARVVDAVLAHGVEVAAGALLERTSVGPGLEAAPGTQPPEVDRKTSTLDAGGAIR